MGSSDDDISSWDDISSNSIKYPTETASNLSFDFEQKFFAEIHVGTVTGKAGLLGILYMHTTESRLDVAPDITTADAIVDAINKIRLTLDPRTKKKPGFKAGREVDWEHRKGGSDPFGASNLHHHCDA